MHINYPGSIVTPNNFTPSEKYRFWPKCVQSAGGTLIDLSNQNVTGDTDVDGTIEVNGGTSQAWINTGWFTTQDGNGTIANATRAKYATADLQLTASQCLCISFRLFKGNPAAQEQLLGTYNENAGGGSGFRVAMLSTGALNLHIGDGDGTGVDNSDLQIGQMGGGVERVCTIFLDNSTRKINTYINGVISGNDDADYPVGFNNILNDDHGLSIGSSSDVIGVASSKDGLWRDIHAFVFDSIPANMDQIAKHFSSKPFHPLRDVDIDLS